MKKLLILLSLVLTSSSCSSETKEDYPDEIVCALSVTNMTDGSQRYTDRWSFFDKVYLEAKYTENNRCEFFNFGKPDGVNEFNTPDGRIFKPVEVNMKTFEKNYKVIPEIDHM